MTFGRAAIPAVVGGLLLTALLWWAGASTDALRLPGSTDLLGGEAAADLQRWLTPWAYDPPQPSAYASGGDGARYLDLFHTAMQIRFGTVFVVFTVGALFLVRWLPPVAGRVPAALLALWAWGLVSAMLAVTVSAPWQIASYGHGSYRFLPNLAGSTAGGREVAAVVGLVVAAATVLLGRATTKGAGPLPRREVPARAARIAATAGTAVIALSLLVLSYQPVAAEIQTAPYGGGFLSEPGDLLREWLLLGGWSGPSGTPVGDWLLARSSDVLVLAVVWWALRLLPGLLTRATIPAMAVGTVCATVVGLVAGQLLQVVTVGGGLKWGLRYIVGNLGSGVPAALTWGLVAGAVAALTLRATAPKEAAAPDTARA
ncbi:hypothetical protein [Streptomyces sp. NBC_00566]|uniref:hypothetical protein n=1 Tax=Streptomyces sp. NBC_00566 TaxID=2975778 RepID=UPI002E81EEB7|nr:hypothetical protein [Streptomyces sp. NBC_00566]WUB85871.1 hypothetical protein OG812_04390 [Streptomyces sp. NBC_00566]